MLEILRRREILHLRSVCPFVPQAGRGGGGFRIFSYIRWLAIFRVQNFEFQYFGGGGGGGIQKIEYFKGYEDLVDVFLGSSQNWTIFRGHFYEFKGLF